jgi:hypothetical protein
MRSFIVGTASFRELLLRQIKRDETGWGMWHALARREVHSMFWRGNLKEKVTFKT